MAVLSAPPMGNLTVGAETSLVVVVERVLTGVLVNICYILGHVHVTYMFVCIGSRGW